MTPQEILTAITLAVSGWTLVKVIGMGERLAALTERTSKIPCINCTHENKTT
jgi:hypothetical protein